MAQSESSKSFADAILLDDLQGYLRQQQEDPANHLAPYQAGLIYTRLGQFDQAARSYQQAIQRFPDFEQAYYNLGAAFTALGRHGEAEQAYRRAIALDGKDAEAWANLGALQEGQGKLDDALASFAKAVELDPAEHEAQLRMARIHMARADYGRAREVCEAVLERHPELPEAWNDLGLVQFHEGQRAGAEGCYRKAIEFRETYAQAWCNLGNVLQANGDLAGAEQAYRSAVACDERDADIWFNLGEFYFQRGHRDAERCLLRTVELNRADLEAWDLLHRWYQEHPNTQRLLGVLRVLTIARPEDRGLLRELARTAELEREFALAVSSYRRLLELEPGDDGAHLGLVRVSLREGQLLEAYRHLHEVPSSAPEIVDQWIHLGHRLRHRGRRDEAEQCFRRALEHRPGEPELSHYLGEIAQEREEWEQAFDHYERAGEMTRNDRHVWIPLMRHFYGRGDHARAAACLEHLDEVALYLPGLWIEFDEVYDKAGRRAELWGRIERWLELGLAGSAHWARLAELYDRAGETARATACRARATPAPAGVASPADAVRQYLQPAPELPMEGEEPPAEVRADAEGRDAEYWIEQGEAHVRQGRVEDAIDSLQRAISLDLPRFRAWFRIGALFHAIGRVGEAEGAFRRATELNPEEAKGWYNLGVCLAEQGRREAARECFQRALGLQRRFGKAWDWLGLLHFDAGQFDQARRCFVRCLAVTRESANAWHNLGMLYRAMGRAAESERCLAQAGRLGGVKESAGIPASHRDLPGPRIDVQRD